ncbi:S1C family serine protease [Blautia marasmi]|uniref:S1C family serine protease n=1 Tax=Blautia marasmi TaxID=1917868 RepID=UPI001A9A670E|nr:trypsin-like peptidase domain-containing protein [Blautia marasmi]
MSEEFKEGMNENRGVEEDNTSGMDTTGGVNFTIKDAADVRPSEPEQAAPEQAAPETLVQTAPDSAAAPGMESPVPGREPGTPAYETGAAMSEAAAAKEPDHTNTDSAGEKAEEPAAAPTPENPVYARSYKGEPKKEEWYEKERKKNYDSYKFSSPIPPENNKKERPRRSQGGIGKKLGTAAACAAVFGLVAGVVFQATNYVGDKVNPKENIKIENTQTTGDNSAKENNAISTGNTDSSGATVAQVAKNAMPSIVSIVGVSVQELPDIYKYFYGEQAQEAKSSGSGIIVSQNDTELLIATNNHVVSGADSLTVFFTNQDGSAVTSSQVEKTSSEQGEGTEESENPGSAVAAQVKGTDADNDLAVISVKLSDIPQDILEEIKVATIGDSDALAMGEQVVAIGNALGYGQSVTSGYVSALNRHVNSENANSTFIQTDAAINPGNSGGALLNMNGELVGINSAKIASNEVEGVGFAIPISKAEPILDELMSKETRYKVEDEDKASYLGITCTDVTSEAVQVYGMPVGVFVYSLEEDGPAAQAGIQKGDVILKIDGTTLNTRDELIERLQYYEAGESVEFVISRAQNGEYKEQTVTVTLGAKKDAKTTDKAADKGEEQSR